MKYKNVKISEEYYNDFMRLFNTFHNDAADITHEFERNRRVKELNFFYCKYLYYTIIDFGSLATAYGVMSDTDPGFAENIVDAVINGRLNETTIADYAPEDKFLFHYEKTRFALTKAHKISEIIKDKDGNCYSFLINNSDEASESAPGVIKFESQQEALAMVEKLMETPEGAKQMRRIWAVLQEQKHTTH